MDKINIAIKHPILYLPDLPLFFNFFVLSISIDEKTIPNIPAIKIINIQMQDQGFLKQSLIVIYFKELKKKIKFRKTNDIILFY